MSELRKAVLVGNCLRPTISRGNWAACQPKLQKSSPKNAEAFGPRSEIQIACCPQVTKTLSRMGVLSVAPLCAVGRPCCVPVFWEPDLNLALLPGRILNPADHGRQTVSAIVTEVLFQL